MTEVKIITFSIETPDGRLPSAKVGVPNISMGLADLVPPMQKLCDGIVDLALQRERGKGETISCHKGCENGLCCCQLVPLSPPEVFYLYAFVQGLSSEKRSQIVALFRILREAMDQKGITDKIRNIESTNEHQMIAYEYFRMGMLCPFLEEGACSIYPIRPFACREYNVISPSGFCTDPSQKGIRKVKVSRSMTTATARLAGGLCDKPPMLIPLPLALEWAQENEAIGQQKWPGIWLFERMMVYAAGANG